MSDLKLKLIYQFSFFGQIYENHSWIENQMNLLLKSILVLVFHQIHHLPSESENSAAQITNFLLRLFVSFYLEMAFQISMLIAQIGLIVRYHMNLELIMLLAILTFGIIIFLNFLMFLYYYSLIANHLM